MPDPEISLTQSLRYGRAWRVNIQRSIEIRYNIAGSPDRCSRMQAQILAAAFRAPLQSSPSTRVGCTDVKCSGCLSVGSRSFMLTESLSLELGR
jgi:hypothetical protein